MSISSRRGVTVRGDGPLVVMIMGRSASGRVWQAHQVPALVAAGRRVVTFDNRGSGLTAGDATPFTQEDLVADVANIIEHHGGRASLVGTSLGSRIALDTAVSHPDLVTAVVAAAAHARLSSAQVAYSDTIADTTAALAASAPGALAASTALMNLSARTLLNDDLCADWLVLLDQVATQPLDGLRRQAELDHASDRRQAYSTISRPVLAVAYSDDVVIRRQQVREVADIIPGAEYAELSDAGHFGYLEQPDQFNSLVVDYLDRVALA